MNIQFSDLIENSPKAPGIYKMFDGDGMLLYVGKARDISARLKQYLDISKLESHKQIMRALVSRVEWEITASESDALVLEEKLIKTLKPRYNIMLTDGKMYPMLALTAHPFPRLLKFRGKISQKRDVFGPYPSVGSLNEAIKMIQKVCQIRTCNDTFMKNRARPCLLAQIGRCSAPCMMLRAKSLELKAKNESALSSQPLALSYDKQVALARRILTGDVAPVIRELSMQMQSASDQMDFESAALTRDKIAALTSTGVRGMRRTDAPSGFAWGQAFGELENWLGMKINRACVFDNSHLFGKSPVGAMIVFGPDGFIKSDYRHFKLRDAARTGNDIAMMEEFVQRGIASLDKNAVCRVQSADNVKADKSTKNLNDSLNTDNLNSALCKLQTANLIIVDGGMAQWNIAHKTAPDIPILGVTKGEVRDGDEHFILLDGTTSHDLPKDSLVFLLLRAVRDEAHRFAISYHRAVRAKTATASRLDEIEGIGPARKRAVLHHFGSVKPIAEADLAALLKVPGLGRAAAEKIYSYFHS